MNRSKSMSLVIAAVATTCALACGCAVEEDDPGFTGSGGGASSGGAAASEGRDWTTAPGTVIDKSSGLMWQRAVGTDKHTWQQAKDYCKGLVLADLDDWRMPHKDELCTIVDPLTTTPSIDEKAFPDTPAKPFWTATKHPTPQHAYGIDFEDGSNDCGLGLAPFNELHFVRCVR